MMFDKVKVKVQKALKKVTGSNRRFFVFSLMLSLFIHLLVSYRSVLDRIEKNLHVAKAEKKTEQRIKLQLKPDEKKSELDKKKMQIVNDDKAGIKEKAVDAKFLGEQDNKVLRETKAAILDIHKRAGYGERVGIKEKSKETSKEQAAKVGAAKEISKSKKKGAGAMSLSDLALNNLGEATKKAALESVTQGLKTGDRGEVGLAQNNDYLENVKLGDFTSLNTVEFKFYGYYHRIRQKLEQYWGNSLREKAESLYRQGRTIASNSEKMTFLVITLNHMGEIVKIHIKSTSGIRELDDAAIESFNKAGPFPNPPKGMVINGSAQIEWGFVVKS
jgi:TonB family protein